MLRLQQISKSFSGVKALNNVSIEFRAGQVHALCGENGAGKTTLMNIITGNILPDTGRIFMDQQEVHITNVQQSQKLGISIVYQERSLVDAMNIAENIFPVNLPLNKMGLIDHRRLNQQTQRLLDELKLKGLSPLTMVNTLSPLQKQMVEIAKALARKPAILILDEPTASITNKETETLFSLIRDLREKGVAIIYISHRMAEIKAIADVISVLKDGEYQGTFDAPTTTTSQIVQKMVGRELLEAAYRSDKQQQVALELKELSGNGFKNISLYVNKGEILGLAGLQGSGRTALSLAIFGDNATSSGYIYKNERKISINHPSAAIAAGIAYIPEERKSLGLFMEKTVSENIVSSKLNKGVYDSSKNDVVAEHFREKLAIQTPAVHQQVKKLSGGNQQKVVLAKWLGTDPDVFIINEPTHGVDVGAKAEIYAELKRLTSKGKSILLISSELPELLLLSDRIGVMYNGQLKGILQHHEASEEKITALASGIEYSSN